MGVINLAEEAFNTKQAVGLTEVTKRQMEYWDQTGLVRPSVRPAAGRGSRRLYSYADLLALKTVKGLKEDGVSLQRVRKCVRYLRRYLRDVSRPLSFCTLVTDGETACLAEDEQTLLDTVRRPGQHAFRQIVDIAALDGELRQKVTKLSTARMVEVVVGDFTYQVEVEPDPECGGYVAEVAGLPGCLTQGDTLEETIDNARDAITTYLEAVEELKERGVDLPVERRRTGRAARA